MVPLENFVCMMFHIQWEFKQIQNSLVIGPSCGCYWYNLKSKTVDTKSYWNHTILETLYLTEMNISWKIMVQGFEFIVFTMICKILNPEKSWYIVSGGLMERYYPKCHTFWTKKVAKFQCNIYIFSLFAIGRCLFYLIYLL